MTVICKSSYIVKICIKCIKRPTKSGKALTWQAMLKYLLLSLFEAFNIKHSQVLDNLGSTLLLISSLCDLGYFSDVLYITLFSVVMGETKLFQNVNQLEPISSQNDSFSSKNSKCHRLASPKHV